MAAADGAAARRDLSGGAVRIPLWWRLLFLPVRLQPRIAASRSRPGQRRAEHSKGHRGRGTRVRLSAWRRGLQIQLGFPDPKSHHAGVPSAGETRSDPAQHGALRSLYREVRQAGPSIHAVPTPGRTMLRKTEVLKRYVPVRIKRAVKEASRRRSLSRVLEQILQSPPVMPGPETL